MNVPGARGELYSFGRRNPWKMNCDRGTGDLWAGDVGIEMWELFCRVTPGDNYHWSLKEGSNPIHRDWARGPAPVMKAWWEVPHTAAASITDGFVYRGKKFPETFRLLRVSRLGDPPGMEHRHHRGGRGHSSISSPLRSA